MVWGLLVEFHLILHVCKVSKKNPASTLQTKERKKEDNIVEDFFVYMSPVALIGST
jgi:hypothetical protein